MITLDDESINQVFATIYSKSGLKRSNSVPLSIINVASLYLTIQNKD